MTRFVVEVLPPAEAEIREAFLWYFERSPLAADAFRSEALDAVRNGSNGQVERAGTAHWIAECHYAGYADLSASARVKVVAYVQGQLPPDAQIVAGAKVRLHGRLTSVLLCARLLLPRVTLEHAVRFR